MSYNPPQISAPSGRNDCGGSLAELGENLPEQPSVAGVVLSSQTLLLVSKLKGEGKRSMLGEMLIGAWNALELNYGPEAYVHCAHSARELIEKAPKFLDNALEKKSSMDLKSEVMALDQGWVKIKNTPLGSSTPPWQGSVNGRLRRWLDKADNFLERFRLNYPTRNKEFVDAINALDASGQPLPHAVMVAKVKEWSELRDYFVDIGHHKRPADPVELRVKLVQLESILLTLISPEPIPVMDEIDALIAEGEKK